MTTRRQEHPEFPPLDITMPKTSLVTPRNAPQAGQFRPTDEDKAQLISWLRKALTEWGSYGAVERLLDCPGVRWSRGTVWRIINDGVANDLKPYNLDGMDAAKWARWKAVSAGLQNVRFIAPGGVIGMHVLPPMTIILGLPQLCFCGCGTWFVKITPNQKYLSAEHRKRHYQARKLAQAAAQSQEAQCPQTTCTA